MGAKANRAYLAYVKETSWGTPPTDPVFQKVNYKSENFTYEVDSQIPDTIRDDRMISDVILKSAGAVGGYEFEFQSKASGPEDYHLLAALWAENWTAGIPAETAEGAIITASTNEIDLSAISGTPSVFAVDQRIKITGSASGNDGIYLINAIPSPGKYTVVETLTADETLPAGALVQGSETAKNGVYQHSFMFERGHTDVSEYFLFSGMVCNEFSLKFEAGDIVNGSYSFVGKDTIVNSVGMGASYEPAVTTQIMSTGFNVGNVKLDGQPIDACLLMGLELNINNNVEGKLAVGNFGFCATAEGEFEAGGEISLYFNDSMMYERFILNIAFSLQFELTDNEGNVYIFILPRMKLAEDVINVEGKNTDVMDKGNYFAIVDPATNCMVQIDRLMV